MGALFGVFIGCCNRRFSYRRVGLNDLLGCEYLFSRDVGTSWSGPIRLWSFYGFYLLAEPDMFIRVQWAAVLLRRRSSHRLKRTRLFGSKQLSLGTVETVRGK